LTGGASKRRLRVRRRRKGSDAADRGAEGVGSEVVAEFGCCAIEAVAGLSLLIGLLCIPAYLSVA